VDSPESNDLQGGDNTLCLERAILEIKSQNEQQSLLPGGDEEVGLKVLRKKYRRKGRYFIRLAQIMLCAKYANILRG
jgi:hypothetical protein